MGLVTLVTGQSLTVSGRFLSHRLKDPGMTTGTGGENVINLT